MAGIPIVTKAGPRSYTPADNVAITGGNLVAATTGGRVTIAGSASTKVLGVALNDAIAPEDVVNTPSGTPPNLVAVPAATKVAVAYGGMEVQVTYAANADFGAKLIAAADGKVTPGTTAGQVVGICTEPNGVTVSTNAVGLMRTV